jgi:hypothetical protein
MCEICKFDKPKIKMALNVFDHKDGKVKAMYFNPDAYQSITQVAQRAALVTSMKLSQARFKKSKLKYRK